MAAAVFLATEIIASSAQLDEVEAETCRPKIVFVDEINAITQRFGQLVGN